MLIPVYIKIPTLDAIWSERWAFYDKFTRFVPIRRLDNYFSESTTEEIVEIESRWRSEGHYIKLYNKRIVR